MGKANIQSDFRLLPVHPESFCLLGFQFEDSYFFDKALPMGCSISCKAFEAFSSFLQYTVRSKTGFRSTVHYLNDFLFIGLAGMDVCSVLMMGFTD